MWGTHVVHHGVGLAAKGRCRPSLPRVRTDDVAMHGFSAGTFSASRCAACSNPAAGCKRGHLVPRGCVADVPRRLLIPRDGYGDCSGDRATQSDARSPWTFRVVARSSRVGPRSGSSAKSFMALCWCARVKRSVPALVCSVSARLSRRSPTNLLRRSGRRPRAIRRHNRGGAGRRRAAPAREGLVPTFPPERFRA